MKRRFVIPAAVALSAHALFLFGFRPATPALVAAADPDPAAAPPARPPEPTPVLQIEDRDDQPAMGGGTPVPSQPEPLRPRPAEAPVMPFEPVTVRPVSPIPTTQIPTDWRPAAGEGAESGRAGGFINVIDLDQPPRVRQRIAPTYPYALRQAGISGEVVVEFLVDETGRVIGPRVVRSSDRAFEAATLAAVERWRFEPGRKDGRAVRFRMTIPVVFSLTE